MAVSPPPVVLVVADLAYVGEQERWLRLLGVVGGAAVGRPVAIQVRARDLPREALEPLAARARKAVPAGVPLILNGDASLAVALGYDGVHWPEASLPDAPAETPLAWRSAAVHSAEVVPRAERAGATALVFGSVFPPGSKRGEAAGLDALRALCAATALPVYAIGGVTPERVRACLEAGAAGVAAVSGVLGAAAPAGALDAYLMAAEEALACR
jgi:thiamine-phosphate diphosphorylase